MSPVFALLMGITGTATAGPVGLTTADGVALKAEAFGSGAKGILLIHGDGGDRQDWSTLAPKLATNGFHVLALDLRGHGATGKGPVAEADYPKMTGDVNAGVAWLGSQGATEVHVVGADLGANLALHAATDAQAITDVVMLSPQLNAHGVTVSAPIAAYGSRPLLIVASEDDTLSAKAAAYLEGKATGPKHLELYASAGTGARMLNGAPELENLVLSWVNGTFLQATNIDAAKQADLTSGDMGDISTTGTRLEDRER